MKGKVDSILENVLLESVNPPDGETQVIETQILPDSFKWI